MLIKLCLFISISFAFVERAGAFENRCLEHMEFKNTLKQYEAKFKISGFVNTAYFTPQDTNLSPKTFSQLYQFLKNSNSDNHTYDLYGYNCVQFANALYNDAVAQGFSAQFVAAEFQNSDSGHAFVVIKTSDKGKVYVDFTASDKSRSKKIAWAEEGQPYYLLDLSVVDSNFTNNRSYFEAQDYKAQELKNKIEKQAGEIRDLRSLYESKVQNFQSQSQQLKEEIETKSRVIDSRLQAEVNELKNEYNKRVEEIKNLERSLEPKINLYNSLTQEFNSLQPAALNSKRRITKLCEQEFPLPQ
jgi:archaellum component FlaC